MFHQPLQVYKIESLLSVDEICVDGYHFLPIFSFECLSSSQLSDGAEKKKRRTGEGNEVSILLIEFPSTLMLLCSTFLVVLRWRTVNI